LLILIFRINYDVSPRNKAHVLAIVNERTYSGGEMGPDHPIAWCRYFDGGRSWYVHMAFVIVTFLTIYSQSEISSIFG